MFVNLAENHYICRKTSIMREDTREQIVHIQARTILKWLFDNIPQFGRTSDTAADKIQRMFDIVNEKKDDD